MIHLLNQISNLIVPVISLEVVIMIHLVLIAMILLVLIAMIPLVPTAMIPLNIKKKGNLQFQPELHDKDHQRPEKPLDPGQTLLLPI